MGIVNQGLEVFQPYARLISVLGDQLISDKWVGIIELVKNCYDADAEEVFVRFVNFGSTDPSKLPYIEIEDDGIGMSIDIIRNVWMKPATPNKLNRKKSSDEKQRYTSKGRLMQGDKGVGRFAIYKLGDFVEVFSKTKTTNEVKLILDFRPFASDEFEDTGHVDKFLHEINNQWEEHDLPLEILNTKGQGTKIRISVLRSKWVSGDLEKLLKAFYRMMPPQLPTSTVVPTDFNITTFWNGAKQNINFKSFPEIIELAPFYFEGTFDKDGTLEFKYKHNTRKKETKFNVFDSEEEIARYQIWSLKFFKEHFLEKIDPSKKSERENLRVSKRPDCGNFMFFVYAFDWKNPIEGLKEDEKKFIQENSVFLYRDNLRVFPYGERGVDWLHLSKMRAEDKAGNYFSYNDLIGFVFIGQNENPKLRDSADREGLMNIDGAFDDFIALMQSALKVMRDEVGTDKARHELEKQKAIDSLQGGYLNAFEALQKGISKYDDKQLLDASSRFFEATNKLVFKVKEDLKITQELAGTGMAVEKATHDTLSLLKRLRENTHEVTKKIDQKSISLDEFRSFLVELEENLEFLYQELNVLQPLFRVARKVTKNVSVGSVADRVLKYFRREIVNQISVEIDIVKDVVIRTNTGLVLQVLLNLMDNAIYWLGQTRNGDKRIKIVIDENNNQVIFADSGPGIDEEIAELIFTEFYSMKAEGRGLGLYIVKELLERIDAKISVITESSLKVLPGANFIVHFREAGLE